MQTVTARPYMTCSTECHDGDRAGQQSDWDSRAYPTPSSASFHWSSNTVAQSQSQAPPPPYAFDYPACSRPSACYARTSLVRDSVGLLGESPPSPEHEQRHPLSTFMLSGGVAVHCPSIARQHLQDYSSSFAQIDAPAFAEVGNAEVITEDNVEASWAQQMELGDATVDTYRHGIDRCGTSALSDFGGSDYASPVEQAGGSFFSSQYDGEYHGHAFQYEPRVTTTTQLTWAHAHPSEGEQSQAYPAANSPPYHDMSALSLSAPQTTTFASQPLSFSSLAEFSSPGSSHYELASSPPITAPCRPPFHHSMSLPIVNVKTAQTQVQSQAPSFLAPMLDPSSPHSYYSSMSRSLGGPVSPQSIGISAQMDEHTFSSPFESALSSISSESSGSCYSPSFEPEDLAPPQQQKRRASAPASSMRITTSLGDEPVTIKRERGTVPKREIDPESGRPISPITGKPTKVISKRGWPPKDMHKRMFTCPFPGCERRFGRPSARETHLRTHNGIKPFICPISTCLRPFSVFSNLKRHMVVHPTVDFRSVQVHDLPHIQCRDGPDGPYLDWDDAVEEEEEDEEKHSAHRVVDEQR